jgi:UDP-N-acetylmuramoylalanine--D-glutamate ligase
VVLIGKTRELIAEKCRLALVPFTFADSMQDAVRQAQKQSYIWDTILLSPGCASFWMFTNYLDRAYQFREAIGEK